MADFKTHITTSSVLGIGYGFAGAIWFDVPAPTAIIAAGLCGVGGMLPDIDSDSGTPLRESLAFAAAVVPMMLAGRLHTMNLSHEWIVLAGAGMYLFIRFVFAAILKNLTVHRGMFHSIPAMLIFGELVYLLSSGGTDRQRWVKAIAVMVGFGSHLILDEIWAISLRGGKLRLKSSFGTAIKFFGPSMMPNALTYALFVALGYGLINDPQGLGQWHPTAPAVASEAPKPTPPAAPQPAPATAPARKSVTTSIMDFFSTSSTPKQPQPSGEGRGEK